MNTIRGTARECIRPGSHGLWRSCVNIAVQTLFVCVCALALSPAIQARDFPCPSPGNVGATCLTKAIKKAITLPGVNRIILGEGSYVLFEAEDFDSIDALTGLPTITGLPSITSTLIIMGKGSGIDIDSSTGIRINRPGSTTISRSQNSLDVFRIFRVAAKGNLPPGNLTLNGLNIRGGLAQGALGLGGGILNKGGAVTLDDVEISANEAQEGGGIYNDAPGTVTIANSILENNFATEVGGGIRNESSSAQITIRVTITNSTLKNNSALINGGGISNHSTLAISNSTLSGNTADRVGGGIFTQLQEAKLTIINSTLSKNFVAGADSRAQLGGGGIANAGSTVTIKNSTLSGNSASSGGFLNVTAVGGGIKSTSAPGAISTITITNSTLSGNDAEHGGDSIFSDGTSPGTITIKNSIVANANDRADKNCHVDVGGSIIIDDGFNIDNGMTCEFKDATSKSGDPVHPVLDPGLDPAGLKNHGGSTETIALCTGDNLPSMGCMGRSPAIDMGDNAVCGVAPNNVDQRGFVRPVDGGSGSAICDIGAFESEADPPSVINSLVGLVPIRETRSPDTTGCPAGAGFVAKSSLTARLRNNKTNSPALYDLMVEATNGNLLLNPADGGPGGVGVEAILAVPQVGQYSNGVLDHGESVDVSFVICLKDLSPLNFVDRRVLLCEPRNSCPR